MCLSCAVLHHFSMMWKGNFSLRSAGSQLLISTVLISKTTLRHSHLHTCRWENFSLALSISFQRRVQRCEAFQERLSVTACRHHHIQMIACFAPTCADNTVYKLVLFEQRWPLRASHDLWLFCEMWTSLREKPDVWRPSDEELKNWK